MVRLKIKTYGKENIKCINVHTIYYTQAVILPTKQPTKATLPTAIDSVNTSQALDRIHIH